MIPATIEIIEHSQQTVAAPSLTYKINLATNTIQGMIDDKDAIIQAIQKILSTDRYAYVIYDWYYGHELLALVGKPIAYVQAEAPRIITEALLPDDRILGVSDVVVTQSTIDSLSISCRVLTVLGDIDISMGV